MAFHAAPITLLAIIIFGGLLIFGGFQFYQQMNQQQYSGGESQQGSVVGSLSCTCASWSNSGCGGSSYGDGCIKGQMYQICNSPYTCRLTRCIASSVCSNTITPTQSKTSTITTKTTSITTYTTATTTTVPPIYNCVYGTATASSGISYKTYKIFSDSGVNGIWARIVVKDQFGNSVAVVQINQGSSYDFTTLGFTLKVSAVRALQDGTIVGTDVSVGALASGAVNAKASIQMMQYSLYSDMAATAAWARILVKDQRGSLVASAVINQGSAYDFTSLGFSVRVLNISALPDGTPLGVYISTTQLCSVGCSYGSSSATSFVSYNTYQIYSDIGVTASWARILVKLRNTTIDTRIIYQSASLNLVNESMTIKALNISARPDGTILSTYIGVGPLGASC